MSEIFLIANSYQYNIEGFQQTVNEQEGGSQSALI